MAIFSNTIFHIMRKAIVFGMIKDRIGDKYLVVISDVAWAYAVIITHVAIPISESNISISGNNYIWYIPEW